MKRILEFLSPEDDDAHRYALKGADAHFAISDMDNHLRKLLKYESDNYTEKELVIIQSIRDEFFTIRREYGIDET